MDFKLLNNRVFLHSFVWLFITFYLLIVDPIRGSVVSNIIGTPLSVGNFVASYYILSLVVFPKYWGRNFIHFFLLIIILFILFVLYDYFLFVHAIPSLGGEVYSDFTFLSFISDDLIFYFFIIVAASTFYFNDLALKKLKEQNDKEKSLILKELNFLKSQFNSHITFNFLTFCYGNIYKTSPQTAEAIDIFSNILRYSLKLNPDEKIPLTDEIDFIENYIELQKLLTSEVFIEFQEKGDLSHIQIIPRIFISFIENAFKHGEYNDPQNPIKVNIEVNNNQIMFYVSNKKSKVKSMKSSGIGRENVKQVLDIFYKNSYRLDIENSEEYYSSNLLISA